MKTDEGCRLTARCYRSMKKNESPHNLMVDLTNNNDEVTVIRAECSCVIGKKGACGHVTALLYTLAQYKMLKLS